MLLGHSLTVSCGALPARLFRVRPSSTVLSSSPRAGVDGGRHGQGMGPGRVSRRSFSCRERSGAARLNVLLLRQLQPRSRRRQIYLEDVRCRVESLNTSPHRLEGGRCYRSSRASTPMGHRPRTAEVQSHQKQSDGSSPSNPFPTSRRMRQAESKGRAKDLVFNARLEDRRNQLDDPLMKDAEFKARCANMRRHIDEDPFGALFGSSEDRLNRRLNRLSYGVGRYVGFDTAAASDASKQKTTDSGPLPAASSHDAELEIDPITMRRTPTSPPPSPSSEFEIDPITMRRNPTSPPRSPSSNKATVRSVKTSEAPPPIPSESQPCREPKAGHAHAHGPGTQTSCKAPKQLPELARWSEAPAPGPSQFQPRREPNEGHAHVHGSGTQTSSETPKRRPDLVRRSEGNVSSAREAVVSKSAESVVAEGEKRAAQEPPPSLRAKESVTPPGLRPGKNAKLDYDQHPSPRRPQTPPPCVDTAEPGDSSASSRTSYRTLNLGKDRNEESLDSLLQRAAADTSQRRARRAAAAQFSQGKAAAPSKQQDGGQGLVSGQETGRIYATHHGFTHAIRQPSESPTEQEAGSVPTAIPTEPMRPCTTTTKAPAPKMPGSSPRTESDAGSRLRLEPSVSVNDALLEYEKKCEHHPYRFSSDVSRTEADSVRSDASPLATAPARPPNAMQHRIPSHDVIKKGHGEPSGHATPRREPIPSKSLGAGEVKAGTPLLTVHPDGESARHTAASTPLPSPAIYKILVYNASKKKVTSAIATSTFAVNTLSGSKAEEVLSPAEIFPRLRSPAKFLRHVGLLRDDGFEMVSGQGDVLVFKKVSTGTSTQALSGDERERPGSRPAVLTQSIDGAQPTDRSASTASRETFDTLGRRNSDTSWRAVRYCDLPEEHAANQGATTESTAVPAPQHSAESGASSGRQQHFIKREEDVFSGQKLHKPRAGQRPQHESEQPAPAEEKETGGRLSRWLGRIASFAADAAYLVGCLYLTGYLIEYFRVLPA